MFQNAFAVTPLCSPSRATFLTGLYPHTNQITDNGDRSPTSHRLTTWPRLLHDSGYETAFIGKWHMGVDDSPRPGFDHWISFPGQGESINPLLNENGKSARVNGYITDILTERAVTTIRAPRKNPFCLYLSQKPKWRDSLMFEYFSDRVFPRIRNMGYRAIRTERWKYINYRDLKAADELYDLKTDPFELNNIIATSPELPRLSELERSTA